MGVPGLFPYIIKTFGYAKILHLIYDGIPLLQYMRRRKLPIWIINKLGLPNERVEDFTDSELKEIKNFLNLKLQDISNKKGESLLSREDYVFSISEYISKNPHEPLGFLPGFKKELPSTFRLLENSSENSGMIDYFYIDGNPLIHASAQKIFNYGDSARLMNPYKHLSSEAKQKILFQDVWDRLKHLIDMVYPQKFLYITFDGPAPMAKQAQQRQRRYSAVLSSKDPTSQNFDSTWISPGTVFMYELSEFISYKIRKEFELNLSWKNIEVAYSSCLSPGEGEHKLMDYIRKKFSKIDEKYTHVLYGPDADLIMLSLEMPVKKIFLLREETQFINDKSIWTGNYNILDIGQLRKQLALSLSPSSESIYDPIDDFVLFCFFVGNDFVPRIEMFPIISSGIDFMVESYKHIISSKNKFLINENGKIDSKVFLELVESLAKEEKSLIFSHYFFSLEEYERKLLEAKNQEEKDKVKENYKKLENLTLKKFLKSKNDNFDFEAYKKAYYLKDKITSWETIKNVCKEYIKSLQFIFEYYKNGLPSWTYHYPYHYPPFMTDLSKYLKEISSEDESNLNKFTLGSPSKPFVQLLSILPPTKFFLLPIEIGSLMILPNSPLVKLGYYPDKVIIDCEGKIKEHLGISLLPFVDVFLVNKYYDIVATYPENKFPRNIISNNVIFHISKDRTFLFENKFGQIKSNVICTELE